MSKSASDGQDAVTIVRGRTTPSCASRVAATALLALLIVAAPLTAADRNVDIELWGTWVTVPGDRSFDGLEELGDTRLHFGTAFGVGAGVNVFWSRRISTQFAFSVAEPPAELVIRVASDVIGVLDLSAVQIIPVTALVQYHFDPAKSVDWYLGVGVAWVFLDRRGPIETTSGVRVTEFHFTDDPAFVASAGVSHRFARRMAFNVEVKVVPFESSARARFDEGQTSGNVIINPVIISAGIAYRF
ncbi:MAG TPA: OmpW family outer membrane protein [Thermoanaerobaculia bacterium]|nr:OmpW family outer membrane protein [Thermoanaerobaculia bacterium]